MAFYRKPHIFYQVAKNFLYTPVDIQLFLMRLPWHLGENN